MRVANILTSKKHPARIVDPFGARPCECDTVTVHTTDGKTLGEDMVECEACGWRLTLRELYKDHHPPDMSTMVGGASDGEEE